MKIGDKVKWSSQSQGSQTTKEGEIVEVLLSGVRPQQDFYPSLWKGAGPGSGRRGESYIVKVGNKIYWPIASKLELI